MDKTKYTLALGGKEFPLVFNWGAVRRLKNLINTDPLNAYQSLKSDGTATSDILEFAMNVSMAASTNPEEVQTAWDETAPGEAVQKAMSLLMAFSNAFTMDEPEAGAEAGKDTQPGQAS